MAAPTNDPTMPWLGKTRKPTQAELQVFVALERIRNDRYGANVNYQAAKRRERKLAGMR
jgi:hypothetical protein